MGLLPWSGPGAFAAPPGRFLLLGTLRLGARLVHIPPLATPSADALAANPTVFVQHEDNPRHRRPRLVEHHGGQRSGFVLVTEDLRMHADVFHGDEAVLQVADRVQELARTYTVREVAYDPWRFRSEALRLEEAGLLMVEFPQSTTRMVPATERLYAAIIERRLTHDNQPDLNAHVAGAIAKQTNRGIRLDKGTRGDQIDAAVALCMAVERAEQRSGHAELLGWL